MESRGLAPATIGRRFGTVAGFYKCAVLDGNATVNPTLAVTRGRPPSHLFDDYAQVIGVRPTGIGQHDRERGHAAFSA